MKTTMMYIRVQSMMEVCLACSAGAAALPDHPVAPRADDGGAQWQREVHRLEGPPQGPGEDRGSGGRGSHHRPKGGRG